MPSPSRKPSAGRKQVAQAHPPVAGFETWPAPTMGLIENQSAANSNIQGAYLLENWIPTTKGVRVRGGLVRAAFIDAPVKTIMTYRSGTQTTFFAASDDTIFDITGLNPTITAPVSITGKTSGVYSSSQMGNAGGEFLTAVNGQDPMLSFDGAAWSEPAITNVSSSDLETVWVYRKRQFFTEKDSLDAWCLPVNAIAGAAVQVSLSGVFKRGGSLVFGATWSMDTGDGLDDRCVFVTSEGEFAIYEGSDPASAADWNLVGRYDIARPLGAHANMQAGGDLLVSTIEGLIPLSAAIEKDPAALSLVAVSAKLEKTWKVSARSGSDWRLVKWNDRNIAILSNGVGAVNVVNIETGAWCPTTGWTASCFGQNGSVAYLGGPDGYIKKMDEGGTDDSALFTARFIAAFQGMGSDASYKQANMVRARFFASTAFGYAQTVLSNFNSEMGAAPSAVSLDSGTGDLIWGTGLWGTGMWGGSSDAKPKVITGDWTSIAADGNYIAPGLQITSGQSAKLDIELIGMDVAYIEGGLVV